MYKCSRCDEVFEEPIKIETTYEDFYGVANLFNNLTTMRYDACPYCESGEFEDYIEDDE